MSYEPIVILNNTTEHKKIAEAVDALLAAYRDIGIFRVAIHFGEDGSISVTTSKRDDPGA